MSKALRKRIRNSLETLGFRFAIGILKCIPYPLAERLLTAVSRFAGTVLGIRRKVALDNLALAFPERSPEWRNQVLAGMFAHFGRMTAETYLAGNRRLMSRVRTEGLENLTASLELGHGVLLVSAHFGNWEVAGRYLAAQGIPVSVIVKRQRNSVFDDYTNRLRQRNGIDVIVKEGLLRGLFEHLRANHVVCFLSDQNAGADGIRMDVFGHPASVHTGPVRLALKTGAAIVPAFAISEAGKPHVLHFTKPIETRGLPDSMPTVVDITREIIDRLEAEIRQHPEQWFWVHKRWKGAAKAMVVNREHP